MACSGSPGARRARGGQEGRGRGGASGGREVKGIDVLVTRFRLRSTGTGVWFGAMAGADMLDLTVTIRGKTARTFNTGVSGIAAGFIKPSATGRFNGLVRLAAERIVKEL